VLKRGAYFRDYTVYEKIVFEEKADQNENGQCKYYGSEKATS
jgi:hypothetical protein